jgi:glycosyltransferase involved in cell wall biosynthesis
MTALYICYQSMAEPLTHTQVVAYLEGLARAGHRMVLLTFEPRPPSEGEAKAWAERLEEKGIAWHWLHYHKSPTVPATAWDVFAGVAYGLGLVRKYRVRLLHARCHVPGLMALILRRLTGARLLFDLRGFMAEEYVDAGIWAAGGKLFRTTKRVERALVRAADGLVMLTEKARELLQRWYPREMAGKAVEVIPCCVDARRCWGQVPPGPASGTGAGLVRTVVYAGKLGGWYLTEAMVRFVATAREIIPGLRWEVWTQSDPGGLRNLLGAYQLADHVAVGRVPPEALPQALGRARAALSFIKPCVSKLGSSPTKIAEYLAAGLPIISTAGVGDLDLLLTGQRSRDGKPLGVLVRDTTEEAYRAAVPELVRLLEDPRTPERCRAAAAEYFDLERVGWTCYGRLYRQLMEG